MYFVQKKVKFIAFIEIVKNTRAIMKLQFKT